MSHSQRVPSEVNQTPRNNRAKNSPLEGRLYLRDEELDVGVGLILAVQRRLLAAAQSEFEATGLPLRSCDVLVAIEIEPGLTVSQMCARLGMTVPTFARILGQIDKRGLVEKNRSQRDGRARLLYLSTAGKQIVAPGLASMRNVLREAYRASGPDNVLGARTVLAAGLRDQDADNG